MTLKKTRRQRRAELSASPTPKINSDLPDATSDASSVVSGPETPEVLSHGRMAKAHIKKLQRKTDKLIAKRRRLEDAIQVERAILDDRAGKAASPTWSRNMEALQNRMEKLITREVTHLNDLDTKRALVDEEYRQKPTSKKRKACESIAEIHGRFYKHREQDETAQHEEVDKDNIGTEDEEKEEEMEASVDDKTGIVDRSILEQFEQATRHMNLTDYDATKLSSDVEEALSRSVAKFALAGYSRSGDKPASVGFDLLAHESAETAEDKKVKKKRNKDKKRKRLADETADEQTDVERDGAVKEKSRKKIKDKKNCEGSPPARRYSTSAIPIPFIPPSRPVVKPSHPKRGPTGPPVPITAPVAPNSGRRRSVTTPKKRMFSSIRTSPPPIMAPPVATPESKKHWLLERGTSRRRSKSVVGKSAGKPTVSANKVTMTIGAHPPVRLAREASPTEMVQTRRPGRPKGSKTKTSEAALANAPKRVSTTPIPVPAVRQFSG